MTRARLIADLYEYRPLCARLDMLSMRIRRAERWLERYGDEYIAGTQLAAREITDMPVSHGGASSPTEKTAIRIMDDAIGPFSRDGFERDLAELDELKEKKARLDILMGSLQDRERFAVVTHLIDGVRWRETARRYASEYGEALTEGALQAIMRKGIDRMMDVARDC